MAVTAAVHAWPSIIAGTNAVLFVTGTYTTAASGQLAVLALETGKVTRLGLAGTSPRYVATGHLVYVAEDGFLRAVPFDPDRLAVTGIPVALLERVLVKNSGATNLSISDAGRLVYMPGAGGGDVQALVWVDREGEMISSVIDGEEIVGWPRPSPDGSRVALVMRGFDIWIRDLERGSDTRLTEAGTNLVPVWAENGSTVTFTSDRSGDWDLYSRSADLSGAADLLVASCSIAPGTR